MLITILASEAFYLLSNSLSLDNPPPFKGSGALAPRVRGARKGKKKSYSVCRYVNILRCLDQSQSTPKAAESKAFLSTGFGGLF